KRKYQSPSPPIKSQIARRLEKIRTGRTNLWDDDDDDDEQSIAKSNRRSHIELSDSDEDGPSTSSQRHSRSSKLRKRTSRHHRHRESATCLICSVLSQLSSYNCCSTHLAVLKNLSHGLPEQLVLVPMTNDIAQHYLHRQSRRRSSTTRKHSDGELTKQKLLNKATMTPNRSNAQPPIRTTPKSVTRQALFDMSPVEMTNTTVSSSTSPRTTKNVRRVKRATIFDENTREPSPIQTITIDDTEQNDPSIYSREHHNPTDPWTEITEETDAALKQVLNEVEFISDTPLEFTPATARRTNAETMAARLPKIPLKQGRFRNGRPVDNCTTTTTTDGPSEYRPSTAVQTTLSPVQSRSPCQVLSQSKDNIDNSDIYTQDEVHQNHNTSIAAQANEDLPSTSNGNCDMEVDMDRSNNNASIVSTTTKDKGTPSRLSVRFNPDGSRVKISKPPLPTNRQSSSSINFLRRSSTDVTPIDTNTKQM
ncbi:unnamed protein product, partial [Adineta ricciae]